MNNEIFKPVESDEIRKELHTTNDHFPDVRKMIDLVPDNHFVDVNKMVEHGLVNWRATKWQSRLFYSSFRRKPESSDVNTLKNLDGQEE